MSLFTRVLFIIDIGTLSGGATLDAKLQSAVDSAFTVPADVSGSSITQITVSTNKQVEIELRGDQLASLASGAQYVRLSVTVAVGTVVYGAIALGGNAEQDPASLSNATTVAQVLVIPNPT